MADAHAKDNPMTNEIFALRVLAGAYRREKLISRRRKSSNVRKSGEHRFLYASGLVPKCATCGCDEDDTFVGGEECSYKA